MSDPKLISPLLDGFAMGSPLGEHDGVRCCPAIRENSDKKYIVKIIAIPASQVQMDALLLAGAYRDPADAMDYFKRQGEDVMKEAELLKKLSALEGFLPYEAWQMEPITKHRLGYEVYLVSSYKRSLDKYVRRNPVTHLEAMNMGLDLCDALSVCRQAGALYVDLKPSNVFLSEKKEYRIGDLGFVSLDALSYTALPDKYRSPYSPPELSDPMASLDLTADTYALGMILYQLYNEGQLPSRGEPEEALPPPINADYELAEIIMKAISPDPSQRWKDPKDMGKALVDYMQRNTVNNDPITPYTPLETEPETAEAEPQEDASAAPASEDPEQTQAVPPDTPGPDASVQDLPAEDSQDLSQDTEAGEVPPKSPEPAEDETLPGEDDLLQPHEMSDELSRIMAKADDLISHETPEGVVIPEVPEPPDPFAFALEDLDEPDDSDIPVDPIMETEEDRKQKKKKNRKTFASQEGKRRMKKFFSVLLTLLILAGIAFGGYWGYQNYYLQTINGIHIEADRDQLTVTIDTAVDNALLSVTCSDHYGNVMTQSVSEGKATFTQLLPNTMYTVRVSISGLHKLVGQTSDVFTTETTTKIVTFTAVTGTEDGSVMLNFTVDGDEPEEWTVVYSAEEEQQQKQTFSGHSVSITGLSVGKVYTFTLEAGDDLSLSGTTSLEYMASRLILAQDLTITSTGGSDMTVRWNSPGDVVVDSWNVRCYNENGYEQQLTVNDTEVYFTGIDPAVSYTVEVTASGMTQPARTSITANPINISVFAIVNAQDPTEKDVSVSWEYTGSDPAGGWLLMYSIDGSGSNVVKCDKPSAVIKPRIPGAKYQFTIQAADATSIFSNVHSYECPEAEDFSENGLSAEEITGYLLKTPENPKWTFDNTGSDAFTTEFAPGDPISIVLHGSTNFYLPGTELDILYVIRDAHGNVLPDLVSQEKGYWKDIWYAGDYHYGELDLPTAPETAGDYSLSIYFNGFRVATMDLRITG